MGIVHLVLGFLLIGTSFSKEKTSPVDFYLNENQNCNLILDKIYFCGSEFHKIKVLKWLRQIQQTAIGQETIDVILSSNHRLLIMHYPQAISTAGKTLSNLTMALQDGRGCDAVIQMHFGMPEAGTHQVAATQTLLIPFVAQVNLFHELSHARHNMEGTTLLVDIEGQAVDDENTFRKQFASLQTQNNNLIVPLRDFSLTDYDHQVWFPKSKEDR